MHEIADKAGAPRAPLPILRLGDLGGPPKARRAFLRALADALHEHGFFYLANHGLDPRLISDVMTMSRRFFALPLDEKLDIAMVKSPHFRGYTPAGQERTRGQPDWREQLDVNTESAPYEIGPQTPAWRRLQGPNQWPKALPDLKPLLLAYQAAVTRLGVEVLEAIAEALDQPRDVFAQIYHPCPSQLLKIIRYPGRQSEEAGQGVGAHRDGGFVTVLLQDETAGLRVRAQDGSWIDAPPVPGAFVINAGELLELATNGYVRAAVHEVVAPPAHAERFSAAFFLGCRPDATIPVIELPRRLRRGQRGVSVDPLNPIFREVGQNQLKSRLRSHPDVAQLYYADVRLDTGQAVATDAPDR